MSSQSPSMSKLPALCSHASGLFESLFNLFKYKKVS